MRLDDLALKWLNSCENIKEVRDRIVLEQFLSMQTEGVSVFIRERKPSTSEEAGRLADDFLQARKESCLQKDKKSQDGSSGSIVERDRRSQDWRRNDRSVKHCLRCGIPGHFAKDCRVKLERTEDQWERSPPRKDLRDIECFNCHKKGHYSSNCPHRAMFCTERRVRMNRQESQKKCPARMKPGVVKSGKIEGHMVDNILLDTGCSRTLVHRSFVSEDKIQDGEAVAIRCAHGDTVLYPIARISLEVEGKSIEVEAAVSETLPMSVLLGIDTPELTELLQSESKKENSDALAVITRATEERKKAEEEESLRREMMCGVKPNSIDASESKLTQVQTTEEENWMEKLDESLFTEGQERQKKSRREKRMEKKRRFQLEAEPEDDWGEDEAKELEKKSEIQKHELDITTDELKSLQALDPTFG